MAAEAIGLVASVATLSKVAKLALDLRQIFHDAPSEVGRISRQLSQLSSHTQLLRALQARNQPSYSGPDESIKNAVNESLAEVEQSLEAIADSLAKIRPAASKRARIRWVLLNREETRNLMDELRSCRDALNTTLLLSHCLNVYSTGTSTTEPTDQTRISQYQPRQHQQDSDDLRLEKTDSQQVDHVLQSQLTHVEIPYISDYLRVVVSKVKSQRQLISGFSLFMALPFASALTVRLITRRYLDGTFNLSLLQGTSIRLCNLVSNDCDFFVACKRGDTSTMKSMLKARLASPYDTTNQGLTPMSAAVKSGNVEAVQILLNEGVDADALYGLNQTSPLSTAIMERHLDIARVLLSYGASSQHITGYGWSPLFYLWANLYVVPCAGEFIEMLASRPDFQSSHEKVLDISGFGVIHRAAIFGQAEDVATLIRLGISPYTQ